MPNAALALAEQCGVLVEKLIKLLGSLGEI